MPVTESPTLIDENAAGVDGRIRITVNARAENGEAVSDISRAGGIKTEPPRKYHLLKVDL
jgi:hypothetical protein